MTLWATVTDLKRHLDRIHFSYAGIWTDAELEAVITRAQMSFEGDTRRHFTVASYEERYDGNGKERMVLNQYPLITLVALTIVSGEGYYSDPIDISALWQDKDHGVLVLNQGTCTATFPEGPRNIRVQYSAGYAAIPADIIDAILKASCMEVVTSSPSQREVDGVKSYRILNYSVTYNGAYSELIKEWQDAYQKAVDSYKRVILY